VDDQHESNGHTDEHPRGITPSHDAPASAFGTPTTLTTAVFARLAAREQYQAPQTSLASLEESLALRQWEQRAAAVRALGVTGSAIPSEQTLALLTQALHDEHRLVRLASARALGRWYGAHAASRGYGDIPLAELLTALEDAEWEVREGVALTFGELATVMTLPDRVTYALQRLAARDPSVQAREAAQSALLKQALVAIPVSSTHSAPVDGAIAEHVTLAALAPAVEAVGDSPRNQPNPLALQWATLRHVWLTFTRQALVAPRSVWVVMLCGLLGFGLLWGMLLARGTPASLAIPLALIASGASALSVAFLCRAEHDPAFELALSTSTSPWLIALCRVTLVVGYNVALAGIASLIVALALGESVWSVMQFWLGPLLLLSALSLALSLLLGSTLAFLGTLLLEGTQSLGVSVRDGFLQLHLTFSPLWQTSPAVLLVAAALFAVAVIALPRQAPSTADAR